MLQFLKRALAALIKARQAEANRRIAMMQLSAMTDRELNDIGIGRGDIRRVVYDESTTEIPQAQKEEEYRKFGWKLHKASIA